MENNVEWLNDGSPWSRALASVLCIPPSIQQYLRGEAPLSHANEEEREVWNLEAQVGESRSIPLSLYAVCWV